MLRLREFSGDFRALAQYDRPSRAESFSQRRLARRGLFCLSTRIPELGLLALDIFELSLSSPLIGSRSTNLPQPYPPSDASLLGPHSPPFQRTPSVHSTRLHSRGRANDDADALPSSRTRPPAVAFTKPALDFRIARSRASACFSHDRGVVGAALSRARRTGGPGKGTLWA
ncbi:hypothetical protein C8R45DRAFT_1046994 [Mycena sanguinolenta]|nr:hypothetical protein C8R45DRAFT_1046994 [Mycena sanguinolenta]